VCLLVANSCYPRVFTCRSFLLLPSCVYLWFIPAACVCLHVVNSCFLLVFKCGSFLLPACVYMWFIPTTCLCLHVVHSCYLRVFTYSTFLIHASAYIWFPYLRVFTCSSFLLHAFVYMWYISAACECLPVVHSCYLRVFTYSTFLIHACAYIWYNPPTCVCLHVVHSYHRICSDSKMLRQMRNLLKIDKLADWFCFFETSTSGYTCVRNIPASSVRWPNPLICVHTFCMFWHLEDRCQLPRCHQLVYLHNSLINTNYSIISNWKSKVFTAIVSLPFMCYNKNRFFCNCVRGCWDCPQSFCDFDSGRQTF